MFILSFHLPKNKHQCCSRILPLSLPLSNPSGIFLALSQNSSTSDDPPLSLPVSATLVRPGVHQLPPGPELKPFSSGLFSTENAGWPFRNLDAIMLQSLTGRSVILSLILYDFPCLFPYPGGSVMVVSSASLTQWACLYHGAIALTILSGVQRKQPQVFWVYS